MNRIASPGSSGLVLKYISSGKSASIFAGKGNKKEGSLRRQSRKEGGWRWGYIPQSRKEGGFREEDSWGPIRRRVSREVRRSLGGSCKEK